MEKALFSNGDIFEITTNGVKSTDDLLKVALVAPDTNLVVLEEMLSNKDNVAKLLLLSETDEVLKIYSGYTVLSSIEKKKDVVIAINYEYPETEEGEATTEEIVEPIVTEVKSDVIYITLRKENESEARLSSLEETVDMLVLSALGM